VISIWSRHLVNVNKGRWRNRNRHALRHFRGGGPWPFGMCILDQNQSQSRAPSWLSYSIVHRKGAKFIGNKHTDIELYILVHDDDDDDDDDDNNKRVGPQNHFCLCRWQGGAIPLPTNFYRSAEIQRHLAARVVWDWRRPAPSADQLLKLLSF